MAQRAGGVYMPNEIPRNPSLLANARSLRRNMTKEERHLWYDCLRFCQPRFRRQENIGSYIADFYCHQAKLVVELDGSQHFEPKKIRYDKARTDHFRSIGLTILRFSNADIHNNFSGVCQSIWDHLESFGQHPSVSFADSSPQGELCPSVSFADRSPLRSKGA